MGVWARFIGIFRPKASGGAAQFASQPWAPTHRHKKGGLYRMVAQAVLETDRSPVVIYDDAEGQIWVRPTVEFEDGRFTRLD